MKKLIIVGLVLGMVLLMSACWKQDVKEIVFDCPTETIYVSDVIELNYTVDGDENDYGSVTFTVDDEEIVSVDPSGFMTALKVGYTLVTVDAISGKAHDKCGISVN